MQVKKFEAPSVSEALKLVKHELGPDAIILSTKNHRKGFGLLSKASVEITAAISEKSLSKKRVTEKALPQDKKDYVSKLPASMQSQVYERFGEHYRERMRKRANKEKGIEEDPSTKKGVTLKTTQRYVDIQDDDSVAAMYKRNGKITESLLVKNPNLENQIIANPIVSQNNEPSDRGVEQSNVTHDLERLKQVVEELKLEQNTFGDSRGNAVNTAVLDSEFHNLLRNSVDKKYASKLIKIIQFELKRNELEDSALIVDALAEEMMAQMKVIDPLLAIEPMGGKSSNPKVFALVGPTGVGKTTTIAKIASHAILKKNLRVGLINVDTYKVAAVDQLSTYAKILNIPFRQATNKVELDRAIAEFKPLDLVLIDTSGCSQRDIESLQKLRELISEIPSIRPILIASTITRDQELYEVASRFKIFNPIGLICSKLDEATTYGSIYNIAVHTNLPLMYFTVGQRVPEDIEVASKERVVSLILDLS